MADHMVGLEQRYIEGLASCLQSQGQTDTQVARELGKGAAAIAATSVDILTIHNRSLAALPASPSHASQAFEYLITALAGYEEEAARLRGLTLRKSAHDLRTPLTTLRLTLQVAQGKLQRGDAVDSQMLERAITQVDRLNDSLHAVVSKVAASPSPR